MVTLEGLLSTVFPHVDSQTTCFWAWIVALVTLIGFFSTVHLYVTFQTTCLGGWIVALVTLVGLFSTVRSHMNSQMTCSGGWIVAMITLIGFVCLIRLPSLEAEKLHWLHLLGFSPVWILMCVSRFPAWAVEKSHWLHFFCFSPVWIWMCVLRYPAWAVEKLHWLHFFCFSPVCSILIWYLRDCAQTDENEHWTKLHLCDVMSDLVVFELSSSSTVFSISSLSCVACVQKMTEDEEISNKNEKYWPPLSLSGAHIFLIVVPYTLWSHPRTFSGNKGSPDLYHRVSLLSSGETLGTKTLCGQSSLSSPSSFSSPWSLSSQRSFSSPSETPKSNSVQFLPSERLCFGGAPRIFQIKYFANMSEKVELLEIWKRTTTLLMWPWPVRMVSSWKLTRWSWLDRSS